VTHINFLTVTQLPRKSRTTCLAIRDVVRQKYRDNDIEDVNVYLQAHKIALIAVYLAKLWHSGRQEAKWKVFSFPSTGYMGQLSDTALDTTGMLV